jgi:hypothetical protein
MRNPRVPTRPIKSKGNYVRFSDKLSDSLTDIAGMVQQHQSMIDSIQEVALELTAAIGTLHTITVKYAGSINQFLDMVLPVIQNLPIIPKKGRDLLVNLERWTQKIIDNNAKTATAIADVKSGLQTGDVSRLKGQAAALQNVTKTLTALLPAGK